MNCSSFRASRTWSSIGTFRMTRRLSTIRMVSQNSWKRAEFKIFMEYQKVIMIIMITRPEGFQSRILIRTYIKFQIFYYDLLQIHNFWGISWKLIIIIRSVLEWRLFYFHRSLTQQIITIPWGIFISRGFLISSREIPFTYMVIP